MPILKILIQIISLIIVAIGVVMIYDARKLSKKWFSYEDRNSVVRILKIVGFILSVIGAIIIIIINI